MLLNNYTQQPYKSHHVIIPATQTNGHLLLGDLNAATDLQIIKELNIKTVITAASGLEHLKIPSDLTHVVFPLMDTKQQNIAMYFQLSYRTIQENLKRGSVLVHCGAGISRSASLIIAYYMKKYNSTFKNAIGVVKKIKPNICPNLGFELQLKNYQNILNLDKQEHKSPKHKNSKNQSNIQSQKSVFISSPYLFQIPIKTQHETGFRGGRNISRGFNRTHVDRSSHRGEKHQSELFIEGKKADKQQNEIQSNLSLYEPQKYTRKYGHSQRTALSTAKKPNDGNIQNLYKF